MAVFAAWAIAGILLVLPQASFHELLPKKAVCVIRSGNVNGLIRFEENPPAAIRIHGSVSGLTPGKHGFHVHQWGDLSDVACMSAGPHYNPFHETHGSPQSCRHVGDLGNIEAGPDGVARFDFTDHLITLQGDLSVLGRTLVVHKLEDDLGKGGNEESLKTGNAGPRIGCCVIGLASLDAA